MRHLFDTRNDLLLTVVRIVLGGTIWAHGAQKMLGWFGGPGWDQTIQGMNSGMGIPAWLAALVVIAEFFGGIALILGFMARFSAFWIAVVIAVAAGMVHLKNGFFSSDSGVEFHVVYLALALVTIIKGAGALSIDRLITAESKKASDASIASRPLRA